MRREGPDNRARHFVLDREGVVQFAVVALGPTVDASCGIDELRRDTEATAAPLDAALQDVACVKLPPDLADIDRLALVLEGGIARDDRELGEPRHLGCDVLGHAIAEIVLLRVAAEIDEGQHRDGGPIRHLALLPSPWRARLGTHLLLHFDSCWDLTWCWMNP